MGTRYLLVDDTDRRYLDLDKGPWYGLTPIDRWRGNLEGLIANVTEGYSDPDYRAGVATAIYAFCEQARWAARIIGDYDDEFYCIQRNPKTDSLIASTQCLLDRDGCHVHHKDGSNTYYTETGSRLLSPLAQEAALAKVLEKS